MRKIVSPYVAGLLWIMLALAPLGAFSQQAKLDSLRRVLAGSGSVEQRGKACLNVAMAFNASNQYDSAEVAAKGAIVWAQRNGLAQLEVLSKLELAIAWAQQNRFDSSLRVFNEIRRQIEQKASPTNVPWTRWNYFLGMVYGNLGQPDSSLKCLQIAQRNYQLQGNKLDAAYAAVNMANIFDEQGRTAKALEYLFSALDYFISSQELGHAAWVHFNIASLYATLGDKTLTRKHYQHTITLLDSCRCDDRLRASAYFNSAFGHPPQSSAAQAAYQQAYRLAVSVGYWRIAALSAAALIEFGPRWVDRGEPDSSAWYLSQAQHLVQRSSYKDAQAAVEVAAAAHYLQTGQAARAQAAARQGYRLELEMQSLSGQKHALRVLHRADSAVGDFRNAYLHLALYHQVNDSLNSENRLREIGRLEAQYEAQKDRELLETRQQAQLQQRNWLVGSAGAGLLVALVVAYTLFRSRQKAKKANAALRLLNEQINQQKAEIEAQNSEIISQRDQLEDTNARLVRLDRMKEELSGMIVHDLKNPLNAVLAMASLPPETGRLHVIRGAGQQMANLVTNLLDVQKYESDALQLQPEAVAAREILQAATEQTDFLALQKNIRFDIQAPPDLLVDADRELLVRVCVNLLTNAIKYAPNGDTLILEAVHDPQHGAIFRITDHGRGIPADQVESIFDKFAQVDGGRASGRLRSTGLGLTFCKLTVEAHGGSIRARSEVGKYTTIEFNLPVARLESGPAGPMVAQPESVAIGPLPADLQAEHAETLDRLRQLPPYDLTAILDALEALPDTPQELRAWKSAIEAAVLSADAVRLRELLS